VAQLGARFHGMEEVIGSIPIRSTKQPLQIKELQEAVLLLPSATLCHFVSEAAEGVLSLAPTFDDSAR
jgi:hypothetical protein